MHYWNTCMRVEWEERKGQINMQILLLVFLWKHFLQRTEHSSQWNHAKMDIIIIIIIIILILIAIIAIQFFTIQSMLDSFRIAVVSLPLLSSSPKQESWYPDSSVPLPCLQFYSECYLSVDESRQTALQHARSAFASEINSLESALNFACST